MTGAVTQYLGAALAVGTFATLGAVGVAWLRVSWSAVMLLAWRRPRLGPFDPVARRQLAVFGTALAVMNLSFYLAIERLPLGTAVAIEFSGPIAVAAFGGRSRRHLLAVALAATAVLLLVDVRWQASADGVAYALAAAAMWAGYIVWGQRVGGGGAAKGLDGLAIATTIGALAVAPLGVAGLWGLLPGGRGSSAITADGGRSWELSPALAVAVCAGVALCSNVVPYALDQVVLAKVAAARFALLSTLLPVTAALIGVVALGQRPTTTELAGIGLVAVALAIGSGRAPPKPIAPRPRRS
ncbi:MAG: EamA family transporter [Acidimicrobiales bacterium]